MRDNQTTRRMPMIVTAMACATASMLAGLALAPSAMAAGTTITLNGADGNSLAGHTFNVYQIGTYTDQILNGTQISSLGVRGTTALTSRRDPSARRPRCFRNPPVKASSNLPSHIISVFMKAVSHR